MLRPVFIALLCFGALVPPARACGLALLLAVDVSGSVDPAEYRTQRDGLALALQDGIVAEALVRQRAQVALMQWTGSTRQRLTIPWTRIESFADVADLADRIASDPRAWRNFSTAIGEALESGLAAFSGGPDCARRVMDISGDGTSNEGVPPRRARAGLGAAGIVVNALVIEGSEPGVLEHYWENVIIGDGAFLVTANGYREYPERIRQKLIRETARITAFLP